MRITEPKKWDDDWFLDLSAYEKLVWFYICDRCDIAGFFSIPKRKACFELNMESSDYEKAVEGLNRGYLGAKEGQKIFVRNFLKYQKNYPLSERNNCHLGILRIMTDNFEDFKHHEDFINIQVMSNSIIGDKKSEQKQINLGAHVTLTRVTSKGKGKGKGISKSKSVNSDSYVNWSKDRLWEEMITANDNRIKKHASGYSKEYLDWFYLDMTAETKNGKLKFQARDSFSVSGLLSNWAKQGYFTGGSAYDEPR